MFKFFKKNTEIVEKNGLTLLNFEDTFGKSPIGTAFISFKGEWLKVNDALAAIVGYTKEELSTKTFQDITYAEDLNLDLNYVKKMIAGDIDSYQMEKRYIHKNGTIIPVLLSVSWIDDKEGKPKHFLSQVVNLKPLKSLEEKSGAYEKKLHQLFIHMSEAFALHKIIIDKTGKATDYEFLMVNPAFEKMTGLKESEITGKKVSIVLPGIEKDPADWIGMGERAAIKQEEFTVEKYSNNLNKWYKVHYFSPIKGEFATIFSDITNRKKNEEKMKKQIEELTKLNEVMINRELTMVEMKKQIEKKE